MCLCDAPDRQHQPALWKLRLLDIATMQLSELFYPDESFNSGCRYFSMHWKDLKAEEEDLWIFQTFSPSTNKPSSGRVLWASSLEYDNNINNNSLLCLSAPIEMLITVKRQSWRQHMVLPISRAAPLVCRPTFRDEQLVSGYIYRRELNVYRHSGKGCENGQWPRRNIGNVIAHWHWAWWVVVLHFRPPAKEMQVLMIDSPLKKM